MKPIFAAVQALLVLRGSGTVVLTWNAGGGYPLPEFLGGPWETGGPPGSPELYSDLEKSIAVCLYSIAPSCNMPKDFTTRYGKVEGKESTFSKKLGNKYGEIEETCKAMGTLTPKALLNGLETIAPGTAKVPNWLTDTCTLDNLIGHLICPDASKPPDTECKSFKLDKEGCFKKRSTLPVFGPKFFDLYNKIPTATAELPGDFWGLWLPGIEASVWEEKGCKVSSKPKDKGGGKAIPPGTLIKTKRENPESQIPEEIDYGKWSEVALWDTLLIRLTRHLSPILLDGQKDATLPGISLPKNLDKEVEKAVTSIVKAAVQSEAVDAAFFQEKVYIVLPDVQKDTKQWRESKDGLDTAVYVPESGSWRINVEASGVAQGWWETIRAKQSKLTPHAEHKKLTDPLAAPTDAVAAAKKTSKKANLDCDNEASKEAKECKEQERVTKILQEAELPVAEAIKVQAKLPEVEKWNGMIAHEYAKYLVTKGEKGVAYTQDKLVAIAVAEDKEDHGRRYLLLSIHSDSDGFFAATFLHLAVELYKTLNDKGERLEHMYIGMDANLQPAHTTKKGLDVGKGHDYKTFRASLPSQMALVDPNEDTVFKCRSVLQTQVSKAGKIDRVKKDFMFSYPEKNFAGYGGEVKNHLNKDNKLLQYKKIGTDDYFPTIDWPVDHFIVSADLPLPQDVGELLASKKKRKQEVKTWCHRIWHWIQKQTTETHKNVKKGADGVIKSVNNVGDQAKGQLQDTLKSLKNVSKSQTKMASRTVKSIGYFTKKIGRKIARRISRGKLLSE